MVRFKALVKERSGQKFPASPWDQLMGARGRGLRVVDEPIARSSTGGSTTSRLNGAPPSTCRQMVLRQHRRAIGLGRGVHPQPGQRREGVLRRVPHQRAGRGRRGRHAHAGTGGASSRSTCPGPTRSSSASARRLEKHFKDVQDFEFTIEDDVVYMLQTRNGKRTAMAALKFSIDMREGEADRLEDRHPAQSGGSARPAARAGIRSVGGEEGARRSPSGLPAGPGAASGQRVLQRRARRDGGRAGARRCCWSGSRPRQRTCAA